MYKIFRFFRKHRKLYYVLMSGSFLLLMVLGLQLKFEEDIFKLLPPTDVNKVNGVNEVNLSELAFSDIKVKDNLFVQIRSVDGKSSPDDMIEACDKFFATLTAKDSADHDISNALYDFDVMVLFEAAEYLAANLPAYLPLQYPLDSFFTSEHIAQQIAADQQLMIQNENELVELLVTNDPAGLRQGIIDGFKELRQSDDSVKKTSGYTIIDGHFFNRDTTACIAFVSPTHPSNDSRSAIRLVNKIDESIAAIKSDNADIEVLYHGTIVNSADNSRRTKRDIATTMSVSFAIILILLLIALRQPNNIALLLMPIIYGTFFAMAAIWLLQGTMSLMAMGVSAAILGVAMSYCLHIIIHYKYTGDRELTIQQQTKPVLLGSLTTIGAFSGLLFTSSSLLYDFGLFALLTLVGTTFAALILMPQHFPRNNKRNERIFRWMEKISGYPLDEKPWLVITITVCVIILICFSPKVEFDPNLRHINYVSHQSQRAQNLWNGSQTDIKQQYYAVVGESLDEALVSQQLLEAECRKLKQSGEIMSYIPMSVIAPDKSLQQSRIDAWQGYFIFRENEIEERIRTEARKQDVDGDIYQPFFDMMRSCDLGPSLITEQDILPDNILCNFMEQVGDKYLVFTPITMPVENLAEVNNRLTAVDNAMVLDPFYYATDLVKLIKEDFYVILLISSIFVFLVLLLAYKNWLLAIIAFLPMSLSWYVVEGAMALTGQDFNLINIVVSTFVFGIGVDYSIFVMDGLLAAARGEDMKLLAYHKTAITISALILIICMSSLLFAVHPSIHSIAFPALVGMITTLLLSYTIQPFLFKLLLKTSMGQKIVKVKSEK